MYDIEAIKKKISQLSAPKQRSKGKDEDQEKLTYFKPAYGPNEIRILPYDDGNGQPFQQIDYYDSRALTPRRIVAPVQWGLPDPIADLMKELSADRQNEATWKLMRELRLKESFYAPLLVRGQEEKGVQIWEMNKTVLNQIYAILAHPDYADEYLFDADKGYDFTVTVTDSGKVVNFSGKDWPVKHYDIQVRRKSSPLAKTAKEKEAIVAKIPDIAESHKKWATGEDKLKEIIVNFLQTKTEAGVSTSEDDLPTPSSPSNGAATAAKSKIDDAFADL